MYSKVFQQIFESSISEDHVVRHVFMDLLVLADRHGEVDMTPMAISRRTNVPIGIVSRALHALSQPDPHSRTQIEEGRRIALLDSHRDWGWRIVNFHHYNAMRNEDARREYFRDYKRRYRQELASKNNEIEENVQDNRGQSTDVHTQSTVSTPTDAYSYVEKHTSVHEDSDRTAVRRVFGFFLHKTHRSISTYKLTDFRMKKGLKCFKECRSRFGEEGAENAMMQAVEGLIKNSFMMGHNDRGTAYTNWEDHVFKSIETMEKRWGDYEKNVRS
jgi:hypothetical protein